MKRVLLGVMTVVCLALIGCVSAPKDEGKQKPVPRSEQPMSPAEYWFRRDLEDKIDRERERKNRTTQAPRPATIAARNLA